MNNKKIAIIGMAHRLPGGSGNDFWQRLVAGEDLVTEVEDGRWAKEKFFHPRKSEPASSYTFASGSLREVLKFDAAFFGISPREAAQMDPQQRMLLQLSWEALENAGINASDLRGSKCGVFVGISTFDYLQRMSDDPAAADSKTPTGNAGSIAANRISYFLDVRGPSMPIDTACSSSLVAFHQAWNSLQIGECDAAIVGGVSLHFHPLGFITFTKTGMLSRGGRCRTFAADADGYVRSEGGGVVILKPLDRALADGDRVLAVVEGSGINCDGKTNGITVPSGEAQAELLAEVYRKFGIKPDELDFLEAHGTGTAIGDPIEAWAIGKVLGRRRRQPLPIGSVKSNLGHLEAASGMAGLMKVLLMFRHRVIPPNLHFGQPNPRIDFDDLNLRVVTEATPLPLDRRLCVGINSFGFGGANAHLVLSAPLLAECAGGAAARRKDLPFIVSAKTPKALREVAARTADFIDCHPELPLYDIAFALSERREKLPRRAVCLARQRGQVVAALRDFSAEAASNVIEAEALPAEQNPVFVFTGNGGQWKDMGRALFAENRAFRHAVEEVDGIFRNYAPFSLLPHFRNNGGTTGLDRTELAQPLIFAVQVGLVHVLRSQGFTPSAVIGHSLGEVAAAWVSGALELEQAVRIIRLRSKHQQSTQNAGGMTAASVSRAEVESILAHPSLDGIDLVVSGENSPRSTTVAGSAEALGTLESLLRERGTSFKRLDLPYPFHSHFMDEIVPHFLAELGELFAKKHSIPFYSTVTGGRLKLPLDHAYWARNIREPVLFRRAIESAADDGARLFVEIGPHPVLSSHVLHTMQARHCECHAVGLVGKDQATAHDLARAVNKLVLGGACSGWSKHFRRRSSVFVELPSYPWQLEEFALPVSTEGGGLVANDKEHPLLGYRAHGKDWTWENHIDTLGTPWLADHQVGGTAVFPAAAFVEMALAAGALRHPERPVQIEDFEIRTPLVLDSRRSKTTRLTLEENTGHFLIESRERLSADRWQLHVTGRLAAVAEPQTVKTPSLQQQAELEMGREEVYAIADELGLEYGPAFQAVESVCAGQNVIDSVLRVPREVSPEFDRFLLHPALLDGAFHSLFALFRRSGDHPPRKAFLPVRADRFVLHKPRGTATSARVVVRRHSNRSLMIDLFLFGGSGELLAAGTGWRLRATQLKKNSFDRPRVLGQRWVRRPRSRECSALDGQADKLAGMLLAAAERLPGNSVLRSYPIEGDALLDATCAAFALETFRALAAGCGVVSLASAKSGGRLANGMEDYLRRLARMLVQDGMATERAVDEWILSPATETPGAVEILRSLLADFPEKASRFGLVGRIGRHQREILDGSRLVEDLLPKWAEICGGGFVLHKSAVKPEMQQLLVNCIGEVCESLTQEPRRILWITGLKPAAERFLASWMKGRPGLVTVILPDASDAKELEGRLSAYPEVTTAVGSIADHTMGLITGDQGLFDAVVAPPDLSEEQYRKISECLLPGGFLAVCLPERSRFEDFVPLGTEAGLYASEITRSTLSRIFDATSEVALSAAGRNGPSFMIARKEAREPGLTSHRPSAGSLIIPLGSSAEPLATALIPELQKHGSAESELLPPFDSEASAVWEKILGEKKPDRIVFLATTPENIKARPGEEMAEQICALAACFRAATKVHAHAMICIVTPGCFTRVDADGWINASLWGFARVARNEFAHLRIRCIDHSPENSMKELAEEIFIADIEDEILLGSGERTAGRVVAEAEMDLQKLASGERCVLDFDSPGPLQNLQWKRETAPKPGRGEVSIAPRAAGLNFRDVMYAMGLLPDEALEGGFAGQTLGMELAGTIIAVGDEVRDFRPGDNVIAFAPSAFSSQTVTSASAVVAKPEELGFAAAATIPAAFYTAYHALIELAGLQAGERLLVHGAAGGVGIAAIQIARHIGAEIFATAGNEDKRDFVRTLGADHVFNSRTLDFADEIMRATDGEGIDVVLNSLAGEAVTKNLEILRPFGRFLELGKRDFYENNRIGLRPFRHNIRYFAIDADQLMSMRPEMAARGFRQLLELFRQRALSPLPLTVLPASDAAEAFRFMQHSSQTGKVVLDLTDLPVPPARRNTSQRAPVIPEATYLVTGGWSGFGLETARWLVAEGARALALLGRRGPADDEAKKFVEECRSENILLMADPCDVTDHEALDRLLRRIRSEMPPLRGVFHAATVIEDALIINLELGKAKAVLEPKLTGASLLDSLTREDSLEHFVIYSSATTFFGNPGQAAYVAANAGLEELAARRRREGLPATCVSWGPIGDTGYLSRHEKVKETLAARTGGQPLESSDALRFLGTAMADGTSQVAWMDLDWGALSRFLPSAGSPRYHMLTHLRGAGPGNTADSGDLRRELERMEPRELLETLKSLLKEEIGAILRVAPDKLDENRSLLEVGMDSLMGVELMTSLEANLGVTIPIMALSEGPTVARLAERIGQLLKPAEKPEETADSPLAAQSRHLAGQHGLQVTPEEVHEFVAGLEAADKGNP